MAWEPDMASGTSAHPPALEDLFAAHYPALVRVLERLLGDRARAEEIAADVFARLSRGGVAAGPVVPWLYRVAVNAGLDGLRSDARRRKREREAGVEALRTASAPNALEEMLRRDRCARVQSVLASLKPRDARMLLLRSGGMQYRELAGALGVAAGSVGTLLARAEREFGRRYRARYGDDL